MSTRAIRTSAAQVACDVCGRTLLRGERAEIYLSGSDRRSVCELCTSRALHGGWVREGELPAYDGEASRADRRRSLFARRRLRRVEPDPAAELDTPRPGGGAELDTPPPGYEPEAAATLSVPLESVPDRPEPQARPERRLRRRRLAPAVEPAGRGWDAGVGREPRHVRAVPTSIEHKTASALELFNGSDHPKTVSGVARSLGLPDVAAHPSDPVASLVTIVVSWELCWYRYEVDLSDELPTVRPAGQGYEPAELSELERRINARADDRGQLALGA